jgi:general secretion pathway protein D
MTTLYRNIRIVIPALILVWQLPLAAQEVAQNAQNAQNIAAREVARRQAGLAQGKTALERGQAAMKKKDFAKAHEEFRTAVDFLPDALATAQLHDEAVNGFCASGVKLAEERVAQGKAGEADAIAREILSDRYDPHCTAAQAFIIHRQINAVTQNDKQIETRAQTTSTFLSKVEEVRSLLAEAEAYYLAARYDLAFKKYEQVLTLDPYNIAARHGEEKIDLARTHYAEEAYNETRSHELWKVQKGWEEPVHQYGQAVGGINETFTRDVSGTAGINNKLNSIIIPKIEFQDASVREAIDNLRQQAAANDPTTDGKKGVDIVLGSHVPAAAPVPVEPAAPLPNASPGASAAPVPVAPAPTETGGQITISLHDIPLGEALRYIAGQAGLKVKVEPYAVLILPLSELRNDLITKRYYVPPEFFGGPMDIGYYLSSRGGGSGKGSNSSSGGTTSAQGTEPLVAEKILQKNQATEVDTEASGKSRSTASTKTTQQQLINDRQLVGRAGARELLESMGVDFTTKGSSALFLPENGVMIVRNTQDNLDMVDALVEQANASRPKQVEIESKFVEISQENTKELGFDWLLGPFKVGNQGAFGSGGTPPVGTTSNFPLSPNAVDPTNPNTAASGQFPLTTGNRSGQLAITGNAIDALLAGGVTGMPLPAPGIFGLAGVFTDPQFQVVIRALNQKKGVDLLSAPRVTTKSGQRAVIEIVREFIYPQNFTPAQIPSLSSTTTSSTLLPTVVPVVVAPSTPTDFTTRNTGVTLEVEPVVGSDGKTIDLNLIPQVVEFEGFINYGSPINAVGQTSAATLTFSTPVLLTENVINQPIFSTRKVNTSVTVQDGQTVVIGGLMREDVQKTEDRTPIIGDIPIVGRLFRTNAEQHIKRNLVIFVTAKIVTPAGQVVDQTEEEEGLQPPLLPEAPMYK